jgi:hypothetical protein
MEPVNENHEVFKSGVVEYRELLVFGTNMVECLRFGNKLGVHIYHDDPNMLHKVAARKFLTLVGEIETIKHGMAREMWCTVAEWSSSCMINLPDGVSISSAALSGGCDHEWELVQLFTSSYSKCTKCGEER